MPRICFVRVIFEYRHIILMKGAISVEAVDSGAV